ncbi:MAG: prolyl oligopeptidase family serine peptidase, partial [Planctomycetes bacterium]|nr:prolyl oligopeptidase family serine peptidase [Planctomycetota bacterium]
GGMDRNESPNPIAGILPRSAAASATLALLRNLTPLGVYILHGDADDNVPVAQAREIRTKLAEFHHDLRWHEQPGAGHWWESSKEPGAECVDWPEMMDFFARHRLPAGGEVRDVDFATASPGVSARCNWVTIQQQTKPMVPSRITLHCDPQTRQFNGTSENVRRLAIDLSHLSDGPIQFELDGQTLEAARPAPTAGAPSLFLLREGETWSVASSVDAAEKGPNRYGPFKTAFNNRFVLVVGTKGDAAENQWALQKARYDAEAWWYRGNGCATIMTDAQYLDQAKAASDPRNVILYGNAQTNAAWPQLLGDSPVQVDRGGVRIGERSIQGENLAVLLIRPLPGNPMGSVGVVSGTGVEGFRLTERIPYFVSGVGYPDCIVLSTDCLARGVEGVRAAGFFANDWSLQGAEFEFSN